MDGLKKIILAFLVFFALIFPGTLFAFSDVPETHPYFQDIKFLETNGIEVGETFSPDTPVTRGDFIRWILESDQFDEKKYRSKRAIYYGDIKIKSPLRPYVSYLVESGFLKPKKGKKLVPQARLTFLEALRMTFFVKGLPAPLVFDEKEWPFTRVESDSRFAPLLFRAWKLRFIPDAAQFHPLVSPTRAEAAHLISKAHEISKNPGQVIITVQNIELSSPSIANHEVTKQEKYPLLLNAWDRIHSKYLKRNELDDSDLIYGAISGLVKELDDPHSEFARPTESTIQQTLSGQVEGIGAYIEADQERRIRVVAPIKSSPAEASGLMPGDIILEVNGEKITGLSVTEAASKIRGPSGTTVQLKIQRNGRMLDFSIVRAKVNVPTVILEIHTRENIGVLTITNFGAAVTREFEKAVTEIQSRQLRGLVLDLRNNPGGFLDTAIVIAGHFIESGKVVAKVKYLDREDTQISSGSGALKSMPLRVLINKGSASASEILAGALQDHGIGKIIGEKSFGKGSVQELTTYQDGSSLKITVAEWLTPNGRTIESSGILPDIEVKRTEEDIKAKRDPQLERALSDLR